MSDHARRMMEVASDRMTLESIETGGLVSPPEDTEKITPEELSYLQLVSGEFEVATRKFKDAEIAYDRMREESLKKFGALESFQSALVRSYRIGKEDTINESTGEITRG